jgi:hypothetical protein
MVMLDDAPATFMEEMSPLDAEICRRGKQLRAQLPSYVEHQRATIVIQCSLPAVLQCIVAQYTATTPEDMSMDGLRV